MTKPTYTATDTRAEIRALLLTMLDNIPSFTPKMPPDGRFPLGDLVTFGTPEAREALATLDPATAYLLDSARLLGLSPSALLSSAIADAILERLPARASSGRWKNLSRLDRARAGWPLARCVYAALLAPRTDDPAEGPLTAIVKETRKILDRSSLWRAYFPADPQAPPPDANIRAAWTQGSFPAPPPVVVVNGAHPPLQVVGPFPWPPLLAAVLKARAGRHTRTKGSAAQEEALRLARTVEPFPAEWGWLRLQRSARDGETAATEILASARAALCAVSRRSYTFGN